jgi:hypothetical protein
MELWIQGSLFGGDEKSRGRDDVTSRHVLGKQKVKHGGWLPVTRDPDVAASYGMSHQIAADFRLGLARALGRIPSESRNAIRRAVDPARRDSAA